MNLKNAMNVKSKTLCKQDFDKFKKPNRIKKSLEDMKEEKRNAYEILMRDKFTWKEGDLEYVGWEPLTEDEKKLVESLKKEDMETEGRKS